MELFNGLGVGYSFDLVTSALGRYGYGSHELFLSYSLNVEKNRSRKYKSVRFCKKSIQYLIMKRIVNVLVACCVGLMLLNLPAAFLVWKWLW